MGNTNSSADFECSIAVKDYKVVKKVKDRHLGEVTHMKNQKNGDMALMKECGSSDQETYHKMIEDYAYYTTLKHKNLAIVYGFTGADNQELYKNASHRICIYFEYLQNTLEAELLRRKMQMNSANKQPNADKQSSSYYGEVELFQVMSQLIGLLEYLQQNGVSHGEIRPTSCFIDNEGNFKFYNRKLLSEGESSFQKAKNGDTNLFLTPSEFESIGKQKQEPLQNKYKADVFSLGMTLLECATLKKSGQLYDWNNYTINLNILSARLLEVKQRYSSFFYETLREMVSFDEEKRPDFIALKQCLTEEAKANLSLVSVHSIAEEDHIIKDLVLDMNPNTMVPTLEQTSHDQGGLYNTFFQKSIAHSGNSKVEPKILITEDTPRITSKGGCSLPSTYREENIQEDVLESNACSKIHEIQGQTLQPVSKKFSTFNSDLTSILMQKNSENHITISDKSLNPHPIADLANFKTPIADLAQKKTPEPEPKAVPALQRQETFQPDKPDIESSAPKEREFSVPKIETPIIHDVFSTPIREIPTTHSESIGYSSAAYVRESSPYSHISSSATYASVSTPYSHISTNYNSNLYYTGEYSPERVQPMLIDQIVRDSLERARRCRESLHKREERALLTKDILNSSTATFGEENHAVREERESINERLQNMEYRYHSDVKRPLPKPPLSHWSSATKDAALNREYLEHINKCKSTKKEAAHNYPKPDVKNYSIERHRPYHGTPDFSERNVRRSASHTRPAKQLFERYETYMPRKSEKDFTSAIPAQKVLTFGSPERVRDYSPQYETRPQVSRQEFGADSSPWENYSSAKVEKRRHSFITPIIDEAEDTFQKAIERTQQTREYITKSDAKLRTPPPLPRRSVNV